MDYSRLNQLEMATTLSKDARPPAYPLESKYEEESPPPEDFFTKSILYVQPFPHIPESIAEDLFNVYKRTDGTVYTCKGVAIGRISGDQVFTFDDQPLGTVKLSSDQIVHQVSLDPSIRWALTPSKTSLPSEIITQYRKQPDSSTFVEFNAKPVTHPRIYLNASSLRIREPLDGIFIAGFDQIAFAAAKSSISWTELVPTKFNRKHIPKSSTTAKEKMCLDITEFTEIVTKKRDGKAVKIVQLDKSLKKTMRSAIGNLMQFFPRLQVLILTQCGITRLELDLPRLLVLDVSGNELKEMKSLEFTLKRCTRIRSLTLMGNPLVPSRKWPEPLPSSRNTVWKLLLHLNHLETLNGVSIGQKLLADVGEQFCNGKISFLLFNRALNNFLKHSSGYRPSILQHLDLSHQSLSTVHVGSFLNLLTLDLSHNRIQSMAHCGIEQLSQLRFMDISFNKIAHDSDNPLSPLRYLISLKDLQLHHNPLKDYRLSVIFLCQFAKGTNRAPGLTRLDTSHVTIEERVRAMALFGEEEASALYRWNLNLTHNFGALQIRSSPHFTQRLTVLKMTGRYLTRVYLRGMVSLEVLDVSENQLQTVDGLETLKSLRVVYLHCNPLLLMTVGDQLSKLEFVEEVTVFPSSRAFDHRLKLLEMALKSNDFMETFDFLTISIEERVAVYHKRYPLMDTEQYKVHVLLLQGAMQNRRKSFHPDSVFQGVQYDTHMVTRLHSLSSQSLTAVSIDFTPFTALESLDMSSNALESFPKGLKGLKSLKFVDLRNNRIAQSIESIAECIDSWPSLCVICLRGNPCLQVKRQRDAIVNLLQCLGRPNCALKVLDTPITIEERVRALGDQGMPLDELRMAAALSLRVNGRSESIQVLDLSDTDISQCNLAAFVCLRKLFLQKNRLKRLSDCGIEGLSELIVLDVSYNVLSDVEDLKGVVGNLDRLEYLAVEGNPLTDCMEEIVRLERFASSTNTLWFIDDAPVPIPLIAELHHLTPKEHFELAMKRRWDHSTHLNLSHCGLTELFIPSMNGLSSLDLSNNNLTCLQLDHFPNLKVLDLSSNKFQSLVELTTAFVQIPALEDLSLLNNPCMPSNTTEHRIALLSVWKGLAEPFFCLRRMNGVAVIPSERLAAVRLCFCERDAGKLQLESVMESRRDGTRVNLNGCGLLYVETLVAFCPSVRVLELCGNQLRDVEGQRLDRLVCLESVDLRDNQFESLDDAIRVLAPCNALSSVYLQNCTSSPETANPSTYLTTVGSVLRGVEWIDGMENPHTLTPIERDASSFLLQACGVGANHLSNVDISNKHLDSDFFFFIALALGSLKSTVVLKADGNGWNERQQRVKGYRQYLIYVLGTILEELDGERVLDEERLNAIEFVQQQMEKGVFPKGGWVAHRADAKAMLKRRGLDRGPGVVDVKGKEGTTLRTVTGSVLNKVEILVTFVQIWGLSLLIDDGVVFPEYYVQFSQWVRLFAVDLQWIPGFSVGYRQELLFAAVLFLPSAFFFIYFQSNRAQLRHWRTRYGDKWHRTRTIGLFLWFFSILCSIAIGFASDTQSITSISNGKPPSTQTDTIALLLALLSTIGFILWFTVTRSFHHHYLSNDEQSFSKWWFTRLYQIRRISLFAVTVLFMPVSRTLLAQFQCSDGALLLYPGRECADTRLYPVQYIAILFAVVYTVGTPFFFSRLVTTAVKMVDNHGFSDESKILSDKTANGSRMEKQMAKEYLKQFYANEVESNPMPQTYLFGAYERPYRYFKICQMLLKLMLVLIALFVPNVWRGMRLTLACAVVLGFMAFSVVTGPYHDGLEDLMDSVGHSVNFLNCCVALGRLLEIVDETISGIVLVLFNASALAVLLVCVLVSPCRTFLADRKAQREGYVSIPQ